MRRRKSGRATESATWFLVHRAVQRAACGTLRKNKIRTGRLFPIISSVQSKDAPLTAAVDLATVLAAPRRSTRVRGAPSSHGPRRDPSRTLAAQATTRGSGAVIVPALMGENGAGGSGPSIAEPKTYHMQICTLGPSKLIPVPTEPRPNCPQCGKLVKLPWVAFGSGLNAKYVHSECSKAFQQSSAEGCVHCGAPVSKVEGKFSGKFYNVEGAPQCHQYPKPTPPPNPYLRIVAEAGRPARRSGAGRFPLSRLREALSRGPEPGARRSAAVGQWASAIGRLSHARRK